MSKIKKRPVLTKEDVEFLKPVLKRLYEFDKQKQLKLPFKK